MTTLEGLTIVSREDAGLVPPKSVAPLDKGNVREIVVHHTDEPPPLDPHSGHDEAHDMAAGMWRSIQAYYMNSRHYEDIAYHFGIAPDGAIYEGRRLGSYGAHSFNCNGISWGVVFLGVELFSDAAEASFRRLWAALNEYRGEVLPITPHSSCVATACPGDHLRAWIETLGNGPHEQPEPQPQPRPGACSELPPGPPPYGLPLLAVGARGRGVAWLQQRCAELGAVPSNSRKPNGFWDGIYGPGTAAAVAELQRSHGCQADGRVGRQTYCILGIR